MALLEKAAGQGHAYAMNTLGHIHRVRSEHVLAVEWFTKGADAGLPRAMYDLGRSLDSGEGVAAADSLAAVGWYRRAANAGRADAAHSLCVMHTLGRGRARLVECRSPRHGMPFNSRIEDLTCGNGRGRHNQPDSRLRSHA
jgi:TPR repeat protein